jgi:hypothetical protein
LRDNGVFLLSIEHGRKEDFIFALENEVGLKLNELSLFNFFLSVIGIGMGTGTGMGIGIFIVLGLFIDKY